MIHVLCGMCVLLINESVAFVRQLETVLFFLVFSRVRLYPYHHPAASVCLPGVLICSLYLSHARSRQPLERNRSSHVGTKSVITANSGGIRRVTSMYEFERDSAQGSGGGLAWCSSPWIFLIIFFLLFIFYFYFYFLTTGINVRVLAPLDLE